ncbi:MAG: GNAT family N-acetyltransferase, partial [Alphaproteobacteria bacterium]|nr:GNAT family N-acetyltransferase [Alphaproteobacteria bacterium]
MSTAPQLRPAETCDIDALASLKLRTFRATFIEGFKIPYPAADLAVFEHDSYAPVSVAAELANHAKQTWVVERDGVLLAYAQCGPCKLPHVDVDSRSGELYQIYVDADAQGLGLGRKLLDQSLGWLRATYPGPQWLGVWSGNLKAQVMYQANGFEKVGEYE